MKNILVLAICIVMSACVDSTRDRSVSDTTVMITNMKENSGGTGVIVSSSPDKSTVLTNAHVCGVAKYGGIVSSKKNKALVTSYQVSEVHDLCLITVNSNLGKSADVASRPPRDFGRAVISGHPSLLPTIVTRGSFSSKEFIQIMTGLRPCTQDEWNSTLAPLCLFLGGIPEVKTYNAQVVSALISPGSSGSAVFNASGDIAGLVFAGSGAIGWAHIVPQEYVKNFMDNEVPNLKSTTPLLPGSAPSEQDAEKKLRDACTNKANTTEFNIVKEYCGFVDTEIFYGE